MVRAGGNHCCTAVIEGARPQLPELGTPPVGVLNDRDTAHLGRLRARQLVSLAQLPKLVPPPRVHLPEVGDGNCVLAAQRSVNDNLPLQRLDQVRLRTVG